MNMYTSAQHHIYADIISKYLHILLEDSKESRSESDQSGLNLILICLIYGRINGNKCNHVQQKLYLVDIWMCVEICIDCRIYDSWILGNIKHKPKFPL